MMGNRLATTGAVAVRSDVVHPPERGPRPDGHPTPVGRRTARDDPGTVTAASARAGTHVGSAGRRPARFREGPDVE